MSLFLSFHHYAAMMNFWISIISLRSHWASINPPVPLA
jgi:hypothetical protein